MWITWVANAMFTVIIMMNYDYLFGATARYFDIQSSKGVKDSALSSLSFSIFSSISFTAYCYLAKYDYQKNHDYIFEYDPIEI